MVAVVLADGGAAFVVLDAVEVIPIAGPGPEDDGAVDLNGTTCGAGQSLSVQISSPSIGASSLALFSGTNYLQTLDSGLFQCSGATISAVMKPSQVVGSVCMNVYQNCPGKPPARIYFGYCCPPH
jgi:hypothetical protein